MKLLPVFLCLVAVAGCASTATPQPQALGVADTRQARLADATARELARRAREEPAALEAVYPELVALSLAMAGLEAPGSDASAVAPRPADAQPMPPPAEMFGARSLFHGIHLASYRGEDTASRGWHELQARFVDLTGLEARIERTEIAGRGEYLRLKAGPFDTAEAARAACGAIEAAGEYCRPVDFTGRRMADGAPGRDQ